MSQPWWRVIHADCTQVDLSALGAAAVITDPPYGNNWRRHSRSARNYRPMIGNDSVQDFRWLFRMPGTVVVFGGQCFYDQLPHQGRWVCWDKRTTEAADRMLGSPFELAWVNRTSGLYKMYRIMHGGVINADSKVGVRDKRFHPTQKPVALMRRVIEDFTKPGDLVLDPFCGSGSTGVACIETGRRFVGIEIDAEYAAIARRRIEEAAMGIAALAKPVFQLPQSKGRKIAIRVPSRSHV